MKNDAHKKAYQHPHNRLAVPQSKIKVICCIFITPQMAITQECVFYFVPLLNDLYKKQMSPVKELWSKQYKAVNIPGLLK